MFSLVDLLLLLLPSVFLSRSFTPDARDPGRNCDVNQDLNNLSTNIDFDHFEKGNSFCEFLLREGVKYCLAYFLRQRGTLLPLAKIYRLNTLAESGVPPTRSKNGVFFCIKQG